MEQTVRSPDQHKAVCLSYDGEARFGPAFFLGTSSGFDWPLGNSTIGEDVQWSANSKFVVVLVFCSRDTSRAPHVQLVAIDTDAGSAQVVDENPSGLIVQRGFVSASEYEYCYLEHGVETIRHWHTPVATKNSP
jgi:hypothetical protein